MERPSDECPPAESSRIVVPISGVVRDRRAAAALPDARVVLRYRDERRAAIEVGYFGTQEEIVPYTMFRTLFLFRREFVVRYARGRVFLLDGRPIRRLGYDDPSQLNEITFNRVRGVEAFPCREAPARLWNQVLLDDLLDLPPGGDCNLILIWTP